MTKAKEFSLDQLDATKASAQAFEFPFLNEQGEETGVYLSVLGSESETVQKAIAARTNERRRKQAAREALANTGVNKKAVEDFDTMESDTESVQQLAAVRLVGWRGITEPYSPENALKLCKINRAVAAQVIEASNNVGNFIKL